ncbi:MAG: HAD hydrolase-like protein [Sphaerochaeta sp.]|jgi:phosphoglycolate phosphatase|nr:HAD hydrolase-like protein [Sphaerochaeta sp.]MDX9914412.1 HAD hydrolase-like protein [Sphaerochaeta sp.]
MTYSLAIFDLDGTLLDTSQGIFATANKAVVAVGGEAIEDEAQLSKFIGPPINQCFINVYGLDPSLSEEAVDIYRAEYERRGRFLAHPYDGIEETLVELKSRGYRLAVGTLKYEPLARRMLEHFGLAHHFEAIKGSDASSTCSKADIVNAVLAELGVPRQEAVLIGDTVHDEEGAKESGVAFIAVDYGFGFPKGHRQDEGMVAMARSARHVAALLSPLLPKP